MFVVKFNPFNGGFKLLSSSARKINVSDCHYSKSILSLITIIAHTILKYFFPQNFTEPKRIKFADLP